MKPLDEIYTYRFFRTRKSLIWRAPIVCDAISKILEPKTVVDVGCGIGDYVDYWNNNLNIKAWGIEGSEAVKQYLVSDKVLISDMRQEKIVRLHSDLAVCLEVAEHIEAEFVQNFIENLTSISDRILISAAPPGQGGHYHVNCQPRTYWMDWFMLFGYEYVGSVVRQIQTEWEPWKKKKEMSAYYSNLLYFERIDR